MSIFTLIELPGPSQTEWINPAHVIRLREGSGGQTIVDLADSGTATIALPPAHVAHRLSYLGVVAWNSTGKIHDPGLLAGREGL